jgi:hypothetical protein
MSFYLILPKVIIWVFEFNAMEILKLTCNNRFFLPVISIYAKNIFFRRLQNHNDIILQQSDASQLQHFPSPVHLFDTFICTGTS